MYKKYLIIMFTALLFLFSTRNAFAQSPNNKFGIHIIDESDLQDAANLVNSSGGQWGYVTMVIREDERDSTRWQRVFDQMRRLKLIPILRLATKAEFANWKVPSLSEATNWAAFLNGLNWPVKNRYVILFNEPNHAKEWGGVVNPSEYAKVYREYKDTLKAASNDFFILPAALDLAAPNSVETMEASLFFEKMHDEDNFIFTQFDGLNSHSYPNPGFSGSPNDTGKKSVRGYLWEKSFLENFGLDSDIPIFITETGWLINNNTENNLSEYYLEAFETAWNDSQIKAITPFVLNYLDKPFDKFSWKDPSTQEFLPHYASVQTITKLAGEPEQLHSLEFVSHSIPNDLVRDSSYVFELKLKNTGQSIWSKTDGFAVHFDSNLPVGNIKTGSISQTEPGQIAKILVRINTESPLGKYTLSLQMNHDGTPIGKPIVVSFKVLRVPRLTILGRPWFGESLDGTDFSLEIYKDSQLVINMKEILMTDGISHIDELYGVIPNQKYQLILKRPFYLSSKREVFLSTGTTFVDFGRLAPLDLNNDGGFNLKDIGAHIINPIKTQSQLSPL